jgi:autotransporter-associated beta strand protein
MTCWLIGAVRHRALGAAAGLCVVTVAVGLSQPAAAQFVEAGPFTSLSTVPSAPNNLNSNTLVNGMSSQGNPVYGAASVIVQSPTDRSTYWAATVSGGIWKTTNGGGTWTPSTDSQAALEIGAIALDAADPSGKTLYAGTGAYSAGGLFAAFSPQTTLLKSKDGGGAWTSWTPTGIQNLYIGSNGQQFADPSPASVKGLWVDGQTVLVGAGSSWGSASFFNAGGLYRSTNRGQTFSLVPGFNTEVSSLVATTVSNQTVLVAARNGFAYHNASGVLYSVDQGASWSTVLDNTTPLVMASNPTGLHPVSFAGKDDLNIKAAPGANGSLFVGVVTPPPPSGSEEVGVFYTPRFMPSSGSPTWYNLGEPRLISASGDCALPGCTLEGNPQGENHFALLADPIHEGVAYIAGSGLFDISLPGLAQDNEIATILRINYDPATNSATFTPIGFPGAGQSPHPDTRSLAFDSNGDLIAADDGGLYALTDPQAQGTWRPFGGSAANGSAIRAIETYSAVMDPNSGRLAFAAQDNGAGLSPPTRSPGQAGQTSAWGNVLDGDGFTVAVNDRTGGPSIFYATADAPELARIFANQPLSPASPPSLFSIDIQTPTGLVNYFDYQANLNNGEFANGIVVAVNAVHPSELLFRSSRLYAWTDPGTPDAGNPSNQNCSSPTAACTIAVTDISSENLFNIDAWAQKIAYGTQDAPDAILAGGPLPSTLVSTFGTYGVYLRTEQQYRNNPKVDVATNLLTAYSGLNGGNPGNPVSVLFDPATEKSFFIADTNNVYATNTMGASFSTLAPGGALPKGFQYPSSLGYIADSVGGPNNGVKALLVGGVESAQSVLDGSAPGNIIATENPFPANPTSSSSYTWFNLAARLPNTQIQGLEYYPTIDTLIAASYGRGVWALNDVTSHFASATQLWFGLAGNDSRPNPALLTDGTAADGSPFSRPLYKFGPGRLTLSGNASYSGGALIEGGVTAITSDANLGAPQGGITFANCTVSASLCGGGALEFDAPLSSGRPIALQTTGVFDAEANTTLAGPISGSGALDKIGPGTLTLTGTNTYQGGAFIQGGALAVGADAALGDPMGQIGIDAAILQATDSFATARTVAIGADGATIDTGRNALIANGLWLAQGVLTKAGAGTLALEDLAWLQNVVVADGTLKVDGTLAGASLVVDPGGTLSGSGVIGATTTVAGILQPGDAPGTLTFTAPVALQPGSTLAISVDGPSSVGGAGSFSRVFVNGAGLSLGGTLAPTFRSISGGDNTFTPTLGEQFGIVSATGGVTGQFSSVAQAGDGLPSTLRLDAIYGPNAVMLAVTPTFFSVEPSGVGSWSFNQTSVGATLDRLRPAPGQTAANQTLQGLFNTLYGFDGPQLGQAMTGLSAQSEATTAMSELNAVQSIHNALQSHLLGDLSAPTSTLPSIGLDGSGRNLTASFVGMPANAPADAGRANAALGLGGGRPWGLPFVQHFGNASSGGIPGASATVGGLVAGLEGPIGGGRTVGAAVAAAHADSSLNASGGDVYALAAYGRQDWGPITAAAYGGFARDFFDNRHDFGLLGGAGANETGGASSFLAGGVFAYAFDLDGLSVSPTATVAYTQMSLSSVGATSGGGVQLNVPSQSFNQVQLTLGPAFNRTWTAAGTTIAARLSGGWLYNDNPYVTLDADLFGLPTPARSAPSGRNGGFAEVDLEARINELVNVFVSWRGEARPQAWSNQVSAGLRYTF